MLVYLTVSSVNSSLSFNIFRHPVKFNLRQNSTSLLAKHLAFQVAFQHVFFPSIQSVRQSVCWNAKTERRRGLQLKACDTSAFWFNVTNSSLLCF